MIRDLRLFFWLRYRLWFGSLRRATSMGPLASFGLSLAAVLGVLGFLFLLVVGGALLAAAFAWSRAIPSADPTVSGPAVLLLRAGLAVLLALIVVIPASRAGTGAFGLTKAGLTRVLLVPVPRRHLHTLETLSHCLDALILVTAPALLFLGLLLGRTGGALAMSVALAAAVALVVALVFFSALVGIALQVVLGNRKNAEWMMLVVLLVVTLASVLPAVLQERAVVDFDTRVVSEAAETGSKDESQQGVEPMGSGAADSNGRGSVEGGDSSEDEVTIRTVPSAFTTFPWWLQWAPSEAFSRAMLLVGSGRAVGALPSVLSLGVFATICWLLSRRLWIRLITAPGASSGRSAARDSKIDAAPLLGLSLQTTAVAVATARSFLRTVRGKLAMILTPILVVVLGVAFDVGAAAGGEGFVGALLGGRSTMLASIAISMGALNLLPILANAFVADKEGFTRQALAPIATKRWIAGKAIGLGLLYLAALAPALVVVVVWSGLNLSGLGEAALRALGVIAWMVPVGLWVSILFPRSVDLNSLGKQGNPHMLAQFFSFLALAAVLVLGSLAPVVAEVLLGGGYARSVGAAVFALVTSLIALPLLMGAASLLEDRRHALAALVNG